MPSFVEIDPIVLEKIFKCGQSSRQCISAISLIPGISFIHGYFMLSLIENGPVYDSR